MAHAMDAGIQREIRALPGNMVRRRRRMAICNRARKMEANTEITPDTALARLVRRSHVRGVECASLGAWA